MRHALLFIFIFTASQLSFAGEQFVKNGYAVSGYDTVAYFTVGKPVPGDKNIQAEWNNAKWLFSSEEHKQLFLANPEKYAPAYDGHCAYAVGAKNYKASTIPQAWDIVDGKLYLNYSKGVRKSWNKKQAEYIENGDKNWIKLESKPAAGGGWFG